MRLETITNLKAHNVSPVGCKRIRYRLDIVFIIFVSAFNIRIQI